MATRLLALCVLLTAAGAARAGALPIVLEVNTLAVVHGLVVSAEPNASCATLVVQFGRNEAEHSTTACPDGSGAATFALHVPHGRPARVVVSQPGAAPNSPTRVWHQLVSIHGAVRLRVDMQEAQQVLPVHDGPAPTQQDAPLPPPQQLPTAGAAPTSHPTAATPPYACPRRTSTLLEDVGDRSLPTWMAAALAPAPTCPAPTPRLPAAPLPTEPLPAALPPTEPPPSLLLPALGAACALQAAALAVLLLRRRRQHSGSRAAQTGDSGSAAPNEDQLRGGSVPHRRLTLRDACTSPLVLLASPFVGRRAAAAALGAISEDEPEEEEEEAEQQQDSQGSPQLQQLPAPSVQHSSLTSLAPPPTGWTRDTWGRLQRQSGGSSWGGSKPAVQHPPPFGAAPGTAYRTYSEQ